MGSLCQLPLYRIAEVQMVLRVSSRFVPPHDPDTDLTPAPGVV